VVRLYARYTRGLRGLIRVATREVQFREAIISQKWPRQRPCLLPRSQAYREPSHGRGNGSIAGSRVTATFVSVLQGSPTPPSDGYPWGAVCIGSLPADMAPGSGRTSYRKPQAIGCSFRRRSPRRNGPCSGRTAYRKHQPIVGRRRAVVTVPSRGRQKKVPFSNEIYPLDWPQTRLLGTWVEKTNA